MGRDTHGKIGANKMPPSETDDLVVQSRVQLTETPEERIANMMAKLTIWAELSSQRRAIELQKGRDLVTDPTPVGKFFFSIGQIDFSFGQYKD